MQFLIIVFIAICAVMGGGALKCHKSPAGGSAGTLVDVPQHYTWPDSNGETGVCYIDSDGQRGTWEMGFRGSIDFVCMNMPIQRDNNKPGFNRCWCATEGCNDKMPHVGVHMAPTVNCTTPGSKRYQCGGKCNPETYGWVGNVCGTRVRLSHNSSNPTIDTAGFCMVSLGEKACQYYQGSNPHEKNKFYAICVGESTTVQA